MLSAVLFVSEIVAVVIVDEVGRVRVRRGEVPNGKRGKRKDRNDGGETYVSVLWG